LKGVSFQINAGQMIGLVGPTGSGKSTIVSLIPRFYGPGSGRVSVDGADIREFTLAGLRSQIAYVLQETVLFRGTVADNFAYGKGTATRDEITTAAKLANADEFICKMPHGYDTIMGDRGDTLSGGQRQRIGIARALIRNNPILILDEPTAALDTESERLVMEALQNLMKGRTVITIAHRLSTIRDADKITTENAAPSKAWTKGVPLEDQARRQLLSVATLPFIYKWVAARPDVDWGIGATVGSVIPTKGAIIPAAVGVNIGCGMMAASARAALEFASTACSCKPCTFYSSACCSSLIR
jgi:ABC-type transport system involved in cytochrome bd biosynthesis fused ATPase/permease subunit